ncbi:MAG: T9SS type A sorting domain-containing protein [Bacteroidota bacterium]
MQKITHIFLLLLLPLFQVEAQQTLRETILQGGIQREYLVYIPEMYDGTSPVPLMFNFHGYGGSAIGHMNGTGMKSVADTAGFILVCPQGSLFSGSTHWSVGSWTNGSTADDLGFTEAIIDTLASTYTIDLNRVYSCGYSNGGYFSFELACQLSHRIAAIGSVGGKMSSETYNTCSPTHPTPVVSIHGTADNVVTYYTSEPVNSKNVAEVNEFWRRYNNTDQEAIVESLPNLNTADGSTVEYQVYSNGDKCTSVAHYKVIGGGHDWPGVWGNQDIDASSVIWSFVSQYNLNGLITCNTLTSHANILSKPVSFFPNPTSDFFTLSLDFDHEVSCHIYSSIGALVLSQKVSPTDPIVDVSELPANVYYVTVGRHTKKLIKRN